jgi:glycosyltransferase involved in cell wall biosynthesis
MSHYSESGTLSFTVFTPTYNRAHTLHRVFDSLRAQTFQDFEWLVVDDGSIDGTSDLFAKWLEIADFPIRYLQQKHLGKHIAFNLAVQKANGELFAPVDSDDVLLPDALERIWRLWTAIPHPRRGLFSGIGGLCHDQHGTMIGDRFPTSPFDSDQRDLVYRYRIRGEKWGVTRTDVFRQYPFPEVTGTQFVPEGLPGLQMSHVYKRRYVNEVFRIYYQNEYQEPGKNLSKRATLAANARGRLPYYVWVLNNEIEYFWTSPAPFFKAAVLLPILARASGQYLRQTLQSLEGPLAKVMVIAALPAALTLCVLEKVSALLKRRNKA